MCFHPLHHISMQKMDMCDVKVVEEDGFLASSMCHCLEFHQPDVTDGMQSPWKPPVDALRRVSSESTLQLVVGFCFQSSAIKYVDHLRLMCDGRSFASSPFRRLASGGLSFRGFPPCVVAYPICSFSVSMPNPTRPIALLEGNC